MINKKPNPKMKLSIIKPEADPLFLITKKNGDRHEVVTCTADEYNVYANNRIKGVKVRFAKNSRLHEFVMIHALNLIDGVKDAYIDGRGVSRG